MRLRMRMWMRMLVLLTHFGDHGICFCYYLSYTEHTSAWPHTLNNQATLVADHGTQILSPLTATLYTVFRGCCTIIRLEQSLYHKSLTIAISTYYLHSSDLLWLSSLDNGRRRHILPSHFGHFTFLVSRLFNYNVRVTFVIQISGLRFSLPDDGSFT